MALLPYGVDVPMRQWPIANWVLIGVNLAFSILVFTYPAALFPYALLNFEGMPATTNFFGSSPAIAPSSVFAWVGHMFAHGGWLHLIGNMLFLWTFGNAVNAKLGNKRFVALYLVGGLFAALVFRVTNDAGAAVIGASGAINAVVGAYLVLYPLNHVKGILLAFMWIVPMRIPGWIPIVVWFLFDLWGAANVENILGIVDAESGVAYAMHIGGFVFGAAAAAFFLWKRHIEMEAGELSILQIAGVMEAPERWRGRSIGRVAPGPRILPKTPAADKPDPRFDPIAGKTFSPQATAPAPRPAEKPKDDEPLPLDWD